MPPTANPVPQLGIIGTLGKLGKAIITEGLDDVLGGGGQTLPPPPSGPRAPFTGPTGNAPSIPGDCPGLMSVRDPFTGQCVNLGDLLPGGDPAVTGRAPRVPQTQGVSGFGQPVLGLNGAGVLPRVVNRQVFECPPDHVLGKDNVCYDSLPKSKRKWNPGAKPLLTGGEMNAISKAARAAGRLSRTQKRLKKTSKAIAKAC